MIRTFFLAVLLVAPAVATAQTLAGVARAVDGDSLSIGEHQIRLFGIDAPEYRQTCQVNASPWACGADAAAALRMAVHGKQLTCIARDRDVYGRTVASCLAAGQDVGAAMVNQGLAVVLDNGRADYAAVEDQAKRAQRGIWASEFVTPAEYRVAERGELLRADRVATTQRHAEVRTTTYQFRNCAQARAAGMAPMYRGQPSYNPNLDGDGDGIACEPYRGRR
jgi:endonuclease YncB( thermonuclease family)